MRPVRRADGVAGARGSKEAASERIKVKMLQSVHRQKGLRLRVMGRDVFCIPGDIVPRAAFETRIALNGKPLKAHSGMQLFAAGIGKRDQRACRSDSLQNQYAQQRAVQTGADAP